MKKNVVFWIGVKNEKYSEKYGGWDWMDISRKTWEYWCKKNDVLFVPFEKPIEDDLSRFRINWQKALFVFVRERVKSIIILNNFFIKISSVYLVSISSQPSSSL